MPILPLDHPEPFAATLGVMLYPGTEEHEGRLARAFAALWIANVLRHYPEARGRLKSVAAKHLLIDASWPLKDLDRRWSGGLAIGEIFKTLYTLASRKPGLASWEKAITIYRRVSGSSRSELWEHKARFSAVAHLWGAWSIREGRFTSHPELQYDGWDDFQCFLTEAEILRDFGQNWRRRVAKSMPLLPEDAWRVPPGWQPPARKESWPSTGLIPGLSLPDRLMTRFRHHGRPSKAAYL